MNKKRNWIIAIIITAAAGMFTLQNVSAPSMADLPIISITFTNTATVSPTPTYAGCGYMWAYHDDPILTAKLTEAIRPLDAAASANAQLFGEDCVYADGHSTFTTMETDFYVRLPVDDLTDNEEFGDWIKQLMQIITALPEDEIEGNPGFVEFSFIKSATERITIRIGIKDYLINDSNTSGLELFQKFYTPRPPPVTHAPITPTPTP